MRFLIPHSILSIKHSTLFNKEDIAFDKWKIFLDIAFDICKK